ncbi:carbon monoxide dehydrogenase [Flavobacteriaceae bacterium R38]|nr:carbon monoxide dehydrogenase [Flavobacteriaceae bacterium R38]
MKINGKYDINASSDVIWKMILDPEVLEKITPGIKSLETTDTDTYKAVSEVKIGPVKGAFNGNLSIKDKKEKESCLLVIDQKSKIGNVVAEIGIKLAPSEETNTEIQYTGEAKLSGKLAVMGQRIMSGVVSTLSKQFFKALEKEIENK